VPSAAVLGDALQSIIDLAEQIPSLSDVVLHRLRRVANEVFDIVG
jgi:hypothetical protein